MILGGSSSALNLLRIYRRFGSEWLVIEFGPRLISREDEDVSHAIAGFLKEEGIDVRVDSKIVRVLEGEAERESLGRGKGRMDREGSRRLPERICSLRPVGDRTLTTLASTRRV